MDSSVIACKTADHLLIEWVCLQVLTVVDVSLQNAAPCIRIFAAVLALARSFQGYARFARLLGDVTHDAKELMKEYNVVEVR